MKKSLSQLDYQSMLNRAFSRYEMIIECRKNVNAIVREMASKNYSNDEILKMVDSDRAYNGRETIKR